MTWRYEKYFPLFFQLIVFLKVIENICYHEMEV